jgi:hypothetical protein
MINDRSEPPKYIRVSDRTSTDKRSTGSMEYVYKNEYLGRTDRIKKISDRNEIVRGIAPRMKTREIIVL